MNKWNDIDRIVELIKKDQVGSITEQESELLSDILNDKAMSDIYNQLGDDEYIQSKFREYNRFSYTEAFNKFTKQAVNNRTRRILIRISGIAASLIVFFSVAYFIISYNKIDEKILAEDIITPGKNVAELFLANGSKIILDDNTFNVKI